MKLIQYLLVLIVVTILLMVRQKRGYYSSALSRFGFVLISISSLIGILFPGIFQTIAEFLEVGRGADLLIYLNVVTLFSGILLIFIKIKHLEARETSIVREVAIQEAVRGQHR